MELLTIINFVFLLFLSLCMRLNVKRIGEDFDYVISQEESNHKLILHCRDLIDVNELQIKHIRKFLKGIENNRTKETQ